jgi:hypothetical protein
MLPQGAGHKSFLLLFFKKEEKIFGGLEETLNG